MVDASGAARLSRREAVVLSTLPSLNSAVVINAIQATKSNTASTNADALRPLRWYHHSASDAARNAPEA